MEEALYRMHEQFTYVPEIRGGYTPADYKQYVLAGMGGSHLAAGLLKRWKPGCNLYVHRSYGLPPYDESFLEDSLLIACSYSGNTEEVLSFAQAALDRRLPLAVITAGGTLLQFAEEHDLPHIVLPGGLQPRAALGYMLIAMATFAGEPGCVSDVHRLADTFDATVYKTLGEEIARDIGGAIPIIYASQENVSIAYTWKITCNETAKIPSFYNLLPEANHNEMQSFEAIDIPFHFIMLQDDDDHPRIQTRMDVLAAMLEERGFGVTSLRVPGETVLERMFASIVTGMWVAVSLAQQRGVDPEHVPMIEAFKKEMKKAPFDPLDVSGWFL